MSGRFLIFLRIPLVGLRPLDNHQDNARLEGSGFHGCLDCASQAARCCVPRHPGRKLPGDPALSGPKTNVWVNGRNQKPGLSQSVFADTACHLLRQAGRSQMVNRVAFRLTH